MEQENDGTESTTSLSSDLENVEQPSKQSPKKCGSTLQLIIISLVIIAAAYSLFYFILTTVTQQRIEASKLSKLTFSGKILSLSLVLLHSQGQPKKKQLVCVAKLIVER